MGVELTEKKNSNKMTTPPSTKKIPALIARHANIANKNHKITVGDATIVHPHASLLATNGHRCRMVDHVVFVMPFLMGKKKESDANLRAKREIFFFAFETKIIYSMMPKILISLFI